jgi:hypothetical protein
MAITLKMPTKTEVEKQNRSSRFLWIEKFLWLEMRIIRVYGQTKADLSRENPRSVIAEERQTNPFRVSSHLSAARRLARRQLQKQEILLLKLDVTRAISLLCFSSQMVSL